MKKDFDKTRNYYKELFDLDSAESISITESESNLIKNCREEMIKDIVECGSEDNKKDLIYYLIESERLPILLKENGIILERGLPFREDEYLKSNEQYSLGCFNDGNREFGKHSAYFKFYNNRDVSRATKVARITFLNPSYIHHRDPQGKAPWELDVDERKDLNNILHRIVYGESVWYWLTYEFYILTGLEFDFGTTIPDYNYIRENVDKELTKKDAADKTTVLKTTRRNRRRK